MGLQIRYRLSQKRISFYKYERNTKLISIYCKYKVRNLSYKLLLPIAGLKIVFGKWFEIKALEPPELKVVKVDPKRNLIIRISGGEHDIQKYNK